MSGQLDKAIPLKDLNVAAPCSANWDEMDGDERARFCHQCKLNVYHLSNMTQAEAEELLRKKEGRLCIRFFQREDGTVLTANCPVGLSALRKRLAWISAGIAAGFFLAASGALSVWGKMRGQPENSASQPSPPSTAAPVQALTNWANPPAPPPTTGGRMVMGDWCPAPVKSAPAPAPVPATPQK